ncbi:hypothetical protein acsn021_42860 [Anaerocolumna cellulosilytica]|uniref:Uncharacterized protein n=1 Tax=Anaerocolumna cellulosilytica TaxID=433286 RepID=A0A6S6R9B6_9FIRM|nr:YwmB family TATA-box binding protein [Anaerocolumna cellulosilytica]MBB5195244.1 ribosomal protein S25 [Anaerocolumna cellulosilytica]BCJ96717.1 hypothetical protein acsn021_42860 [Anaerocolumna cellulosilytica]
MEILSSLSKEFKKIMIEKKSKMTIYVLGVLWIAVIMQIAVNNFLIPKSNILEAFISTNTEVSSFELEMVADYGNNYLSESDKRDLVVFIAGKIGLTANKDVIVNRNGEDSEALLQKIGKNSETLIKVISKEQENEEGIPELKHYIIVDLKLYENLDSILEYHKLLDKVFKEIKTNKVETTMQLSSKYKGRLSLDNMNTLADRMVDNLQGKIAYDNRSEKLFTIYAYTGLLDEYVTSMGTKINIHVAMNYDETTDSTNVYLGTPVINGGY